MRRSLIPAVAALAFASLARRSRPRRPPQSLRREARRHRQDAHARSRRQRIPARGKPPTSSSSRIATGPYVYLCGFVELRRPDLRHPQHVGAEEDLRLDDRESRAAPRHRRDGRQVLQDRQQVLLRAVVPVHAGQPRRRPRRRDLRRHRPARSRARSKSSRASGIRSRPADSTTRSRTSTPTDARSTSRRSISRRRSSTISRRS